MRRCVLPAIPVFMAVVAACGGGGDGPVTPAQTPSSPTGGTFTLTSPAGVDVGLMPAVAIRVQGDLRFLT